MTPRNRQVRVLHVAEAFGGGLLEMVRLVAERAAAAGHPSAIAYGRRPETPADPRAEIGPAVSLFALDWRRGSPHTHVAVARLLRALAHEWGADVVHLHSSFAGVVGAAALAGRVPLVLTPHAFASAQLNTPLARRLAFRLAERIAVRRCDLVGAVSHSEARVARALGARDVAVVPNGIPELDARPPGRPDRTPGARPRVVAIGRIIAQRRPEACARILAAVAGAADVEWLGGGGEAARAALSAAGVPVTGWLPREQLLARLGAADAYLHWTSWDGQPLSVLEAMARDVVVVASDIEPNRELLHPDQLCRTEAEAVTALRRAVAEPAFAGRLLDHQAERRAAHSAERMVADWIEVYQRLAQRAAAGP